MNVFINNENISLPDDRMTVEELINREKIDTNGTAVAINDKLIKRDKWSVTFLKELDNITIISAAYGG